MDHEKAVATAAANLRGAISAARQAGYRVDFPVHALESVPVSETARVVPTEPVAEEIPVPVIGRRNPPSTTS